MENIKEYTFEEAIDALNNLQETITLYHISETEFPADYEMVPKVPESDYEDQETSRICFAKTIQGCLIGNSEDANLIDKEFYVYTIESDDYYEPTVREVADVEATGEVWILHPVVPAFYGKIKVVEKVGEKEYTFGDNTFMVPEWKYVEVK